jgi:ribonuclease P protein component
LTLIHSVRIQTLKKRAEFLRVRGGGRATAASFVLEGKARVVEPSMQAVIGPRFGLTITKKIGNAVTRNLIRRRLKAALEHAARGLADPQTDYVVVARQAAAEQNFAALVADLTKALQRIQRAAQNKTAPTNPRQP